MKSKTSNALNIKNFIFVAAVFILLFLGSEVFAQCEICTNCCGKPPVWNKTGTCNAEIYYADTISGLESCAYSVISGGVEGPLDYGTCGTCSGKGIATCCAPMTIGDGQACHDQGANACGVKAYAWDLAGNANTVTKYYNIDYTAPTTSITPNGANCVNSDTSFSLSCSDAHSGCKMTYYKIIDVAANEALTCDPNDTSGFTAGTSGTVTCSAGSICKKKVCYYSFDNAFNRELTKTSNIFKTDKKNPYLVSWNPTNRDWSNTDVSVTIQYADDDCGMKETKYCWTTGASCSPATLFPNAWGGTATQSNTGIWTLCVTATDNVNNSVTECKGPYKIDKEKPVSQITAPPAGSTQTADFNVTVSDTDTGGSGINTGACYYRTYDSGVGWTRDWTLRTCNSTQLITVEAGKDCQTENGTCTVYVYSYDNAGNQSDTNLRSFLIKIDITSPTTTIKVKRKSTGEDLTAASSWLRADTYTIQFEDHDQADGSGLNCEKCSCEYSIYSCDVGGTNCNNVVVPLTSQIPNFSFDIVAGKTVSIYNLEGIGRYRIYRGVKNKANKSAYKYQYINFDFTPPRTEIR